MSVTRTSGIIATLRVTMPLTTMTRLLVRMNRSYHQSATFQATQPITANQSSTAMVVRRADVLPGEEAGEVAEHEGGRDADQQRGGEVDPVPLPLAPVALGGEEVAGDQRAGLVLQRQHFRLPRLFPWAYPL